MQDEIWARSTIEELLSRQVERTRPCEQATGAAAQERRQRGQFRPGLRVVNIDGTAGDRRVERWLDHPSGALIEG